MILMLTSWIYATDYPCKSIKPNGDTIVEFTPLQAKSFRLLLIDLDDCKGENLGLKQIVEYQQEVITSKVELQDLFVAQNKHNEQLNVSLIRAIETQSQKYEILQDAYKTQSKQIKRQGLKFGASIGCVTGVAILLGLLKILKVF